MAEDITQEEEQNSQEENSEQNEDTQESNEEQIDSEVNQEDEIANSPVIKDNPNEDEENNNEEESSTTEEEDPEIIENEDNPIQKKQTKIKKILIITAGVLGGILVLGIILYAFGVFDPEEPPKPTPEQQAAMDMNQTKEPEKYIFDAKDINIDRLNGKLRILTKYEIIGTQEEERQKELEKNSKLSTAQINELLKAEKEKVALEKKRKEEEKKKMALEKIQKEKEQKELEKKLKEDEKKLQEQKEMDKKEQEQKQTQRPYDLLKFIQVNADITTLSSIQNNLTQNKVKISKCSENNREFLLIGPFQNNKELNQTYRLIYKDITQNSSKKDLARLEFNRICK